MLANVLIDILESKFQEPLFRCHLSSISQKFFLGFAKSDVSVTSSDMGLLDYAIKVSLCLPNGREDEIIVCEEVESMIDLLKVETVLFLLFNAAIGIAADINASLSRYMGSNQLFHLFFLNFTQVLSVPPSSMTYKNEKSYLSTTINSSGTVSIRQIALREGPSY